VLLGFGLAGAAGNFTAGVTVRRHLRATPMGSGLLVAVSALLLAAVTGARPLTIALVAVWGLGFGARKRPHRRQARPIKQETAHNEHAEVRGHTEAVTTGRNCHA
jgi:predicted MFS family arabinose efflux permease